jgi:hypothetical protein
VPGHEGIAGNETADLLARTQSEHPFTGPESACGISNGVAKRERSGTGGTEITKNNGNPQLNSKQLNSKQAKGHIRTLCQNNKGSVKIKQRPIKMDSRVIYRTLPSKGTPFETRIDG